MATSCAACGSELMVPGKLSADQNLTFVPANPKFLASGSKVHIQVNACAMCGHVQLACDPEELAAKAEPPETPNPTAPGSSETESAE